MPYTATAVGKKKKIARFIYDIEKKKRRMKNCECVIGRETERERETSCVCAMYDVQFVRSLLHGTTATTAMMCESSTCYIYVVDLRRSTRNTYGFRSINTSHKGSTAIGTRACVCEFACVLVLGWFWLTRFTLAILATQCSVFCIYYIFVFLYI